MICGKSGSGKSTSIRNLNPETTAIINVERKALPFKNADGFKSVNVSNMEMFNNVLDAAVANNSIDIIIIDSFTKLIEILYHECKELHSGYEIFNNYNNEIYDLLEKSKSNDKYIVFTGIEDDVADADGVTRKFVKVQGNVWKNSIEKEFLIVLFTDNKKTEDGIEYRFRTNTSGENSAKSPMDMFELHIPNDLKYVIDACKEYYGEIQTTKQTKEVI